ncbi:MAG: agenet domain-containing protein [Pyrinomonadaceae bacterium]
MKKYILIFAFSLFVSACGVKALIPSGSSDGKPKAGDLVVAKWSTGSYYEGKVEKLDGTKMTIAWEDKSQPTAVDAADVFMIPTAGAKPDVKQGDMVLAKTASGSYWNGAEVTGIEADVYNVRIVTGSTSVNVSGEKIIKVPATAAADFKQMAGSTDFMAEARKGKVTIPADYKPKKGDAVLAEWTTGSWWSGKIDNISGSNIYVAWDDNSKPSAVNISKVRPLPTANDKTMPSEKQFLLVKPDSGSSWQYGQTASVNGSRVEVKLANNQTKTVTSGEFVVLN